MKVSKPSTPPTDLKADNPASRGPHRMRLVRIGLLFIVLSGLAIYYLSRPDKNQEFIRHLASANEVASENLVRADSLVAEALTIFPEDPEALLLQGKIAYELDRDQKAILALEAISSETTPQIWMESRRILGQIYHVERHQFETAMRFYQQALVVDPDDKLANIGMARILAICSRRYEAIPYILRLIRLRDAGNLPLILLVDHSLINRPDLLQVAAGVAPDDVNPHLGLAWHLLEAKEFDSAIYLLKGQVLQHPQSVAAWVALGNAYSKAERPAELASWLGQVPSEVYSHPKAWELRGEVALRSGDESGATRCFLEVLKRYPESKETTYQLLKLMRAPEFMSFRQKLQARFDSLDTIFNLRARMFGHGRQPQPEDMQTLVTEFVNLGRYWEAFSWGEAALGSDPSNAELRQLFVQIVHKCENLPLVQTASELNPVNNIDFEQFPIPQAQVTPAIVEQESGQTNLPEVSFVDEADQSGFQFLYKAGYDKTPELRLYEFTGGGIGVIDYDLDGFPDVFCSQGGTDFALEQQTITDHLFRNYDGLSFRNVTSRTAIQESGFGQGVAVGDFNSDGFPDVYVANCGKNQLWLNNGDGTFEDVTDSMGLTGAVWTTSCQIADLNADGHPDIYDVNYCSGEDVYTRLCKNSKGAVEMCAPFDFQGEVDALLINSGQGSFTDLTAEILSQSPNGKGLGIVSWRSGDSGPLSFFVSNDAVVNHFYRAEKSEEGAFKFIDRAVAVGLGYNGEGKPEACMGIAAGDINNDGEIDLHITNYYAESNTLFASSGVDYYEDLTKEYGLEQPTLDFLGFGTQFIDANLDQIPELFVTNGHLHDDTDEGIPFRMSPQMFSWTGNRFEQFQPEQLGPYFSKELLGRSVAKIDWNRDGKEDLLVGHIDTPYALLTNRTNSTGKSLTLKLVGIMSSRDAFGTIVRATIGSQTKTYQLTAGSGYEASNERHIVVSCGSSDMIDQLEIQWPSGQKQTEQNVRSSQSIILIEGVGILKEAGYQTSESN